MPDFQFQFPTVGIEPRYDAGGGGLPVGKHMVVISDADWAPTKDQQGQMLVLTLSCVDGPAKGQSMKDRLNLQNSSLMAAAIAQRQLTAYCVVAGIPQGIQQTISEIFNRPFIVDIGPQSGAEAQAKGYVEVKHLFHQNGASLDGKMPNGGAAIPAPSPGPQPGAFAPQGPSPQPFGGAPGPGPQPFAPQGGGPGPQPFQQPGAAPNGGAFAPGPAPFGGGAPAQQQYQPPGLGGAAPQPFQPQGGAPWLAGQR